MATNAVIGALRVVLGADSAALETGLKDAQSKLASFGTSVAKASAVASAAFAAAGAAVAVSIKGAIDEADKLGKAAQKWGVPVEELSRLKHAADLSGISLEGLGTGISKLSRNMSDAAGGAVNTASRAFDALGISVKNSDGTLKSSTEVMTEVAGKFGGMEDGAGKTALAMALFGKSGAELIPLLNGGAEGLRKMMQEADQLGIVIDQRTARAAENFNDNLTRLGRAKDGVILKITEGMLPGLEKMSEAMVRAAKETGGLNSIGETIGGMFVGIIHEIEKFRLALVRLPVEWGAFTNALSQIPFTDASRNAWRDFNAIAAESERQLQKLVEAQRALAPITLAAIRATLGLGEANEKAAAPIIQAEDQAKKAAAAFASFIAAQQKSIALQGVDLAATDLAVGAKERLRVVTEGLSLAAAANTPLTAAMRSQLESAAAAAEVMAIKMKAAQLVQQNKTPHEQYRDELAKNEEAMRRDARTEEEIVTMKEKLAERYGLAWHQVASSMAGSLAEIGNAFAKESRAMALVAKGAAIAQATIAMLQAGAEALKLGFPAGIPASLAMLAKGAAIVASIKSTSIGGFKTGGAIVPGGLGGGDRVRAMVDLEPGEQLDIWRPGEAGADPRRGAMATGGSTVTLRFEGDDFGIGQKMARKIVKALNEALGDGTKLQVA
ncbi:MAG: hypothetical protein C4583_03280 [Anaerolineaceae bacterium]|nr:MAG: hypothetical protein C4583_03280 [Anaerolineaceae bacterium]